MVRQGKTIHEGSKTGGRTAAPGLPTTLSVVRQALPVLRVADATRTTLPGRTPNRMLTLSTRHVIATNDGDPYLIRYTLIECRWFSIKVHHILRSDEDRCEHDHPWPFVSLILTGG